MKIYCCFLGNRITENDEKKLDKSRIEQENFFFLKQKPYINHKPHETWHQENISENIRLEYDTYECGIWKVSAIKIKKKTRNIPIVVLPKDAQDFVGCDRVK